MYYMNDYFNFSNILILIKYIFIYLQKEIERCFRGDVKKEKRLLASVVSSNIRIGVDCQN
jgi:uncharacterized membrane protein